MQAFYLRLWLVALSLSLGFALGLAPAPALAESQKVAAYDARRDRLEGFDKDELSRLAGQLAKGPVALVEFADMDADQLPGINVALRVQADAQTLESVITDPARYPKFMPAMSEVEILGRTADSVVYDWSFDVAMLQMAGRNVMTVQRARADRPDVPARVMIESQEGDLGRGRFLFRIHPQGPKQSLLVMSMRLDLRKANYVARQMAKAARSVNRSANLALSFSMALHFREQAERQSGGTAGVVPAAKATTVPALEKPSIDMRPLFPLLERGDLLFFEGQGARLERMSVVGVIGRKHSKVLEVMRDAKGFGAALVPGSSAEIVSTKDGVTTFDWDIGLPVVGVSGRMRMSDTDDGVKIEATGGAMRGGQWHFDAAPLGKHASLITGWARFGFEESNWLIEKLVKSDAYLGHGISAASEVMLMRALRSRATR